MRWVLSLVVLPVLLLPLPLVWPLTHAEPDNSIQSAEELPLRVFINATLDVKSDPEDWYRVFVPKGMVLNATVYTQEFNADLQIHYLYKDGVWDYKWSETTYDYETVCLLSVASQYYYIRVFAIEGGGNYTIDADVKEPVALQDGSVVSGALYNNSYHVIDYYKIRLNNTMSSSQTLHAVLNKSPIPPAQYAWLTLTILRLEDWIPEVMYYDISWGNETVEEVQATAPVSGWYYIMVNAYNGSGNYTLRVEISSTTTDDWPDGRLLYGKDIAISGSLHQGMDHADYYRMYLHRNQSVSFSGNFTYKNPVIFGLTFLDPQGRLIGEWTNYDIKVYKATKRLNGHFTATEDGAYRVIIQLKESLLKEDQRMQSDEDGAGTYSITFSLSPQINHPPRAVYIPDISVYEEGYFILNLSTAFQDVDLKYGDYLTYSVSGEHMEFERNGMLLKCTMEKDWYGLTVVDITAQDTYGYVATNHLYVKVTNVNDAPVIESGEINYTVPDNRRSTLFDVSTRFRDVDGNHLTYTISAPEYLGARISHRGILSVHPQVGYIGTYIIAVTATDGEYSRTLNITLNVVHVPVPPEVLEHTNYMHILEDSSAYFNLSDIFYDPDSDLEYSISASSGIKTHVQHNQMLLTPEKNWTGRCIITLRVYDETNSSAVSYLIVDVLPVNDPPVIVSHPPENITITTSVLMELRANDDNHISYIWYLDGIMYSVGPYASFNATSLTSGVHKITATVSDGEYTIYWNGTLKVEHHIPEHKPVPQQTHAVAGVSLGLSIWLACLAIAYENPRVYLIKVLLVPLYTRIKKEEVLDQFTRGRIYAYIEYNPGVTYSDIKRRFGIGNGVLTYHLSKLEDEEYVKSERDGIYKRYYPKNMRFEGTMYEMSKVQRDIYYIIKTKPGISQKGISHKTGLSPRVVSYHVNLMKTSGLVKVVKKGRTTKCYPRELTS